MMLPALDFKEAVYRNTIYDAYLSTYKQDMYG